MKRTGAKNYRYTDVHWQSVPTRARFCVLGAIPPVGNFAKIHARGRGGLLGTVRKDLIPPWGRGGRRAGTAAAADRWGAGTGPDGGAAQEAQPGRRSGTGKRRAAGRAGHTGRGGAVGRRSRSGRKNGGAARQAHVGRTTGGVAGAAAGRGEMGCRARAGRTARERGQISRGGRRQARENGPPGAGPGRARRAKPGTRGAGRRRKAASKLSACVGFPPQVTPRVRRTARSPPFSLIR